MQKKSKDKPIIWTFEARHNLELIFDHIVENFSFDLAIEKTEIIMDEVETLSQFPRKGKISVHFNEMRELVVDGNTIYYRNNEVNIVVASIRPRRTQNKKLK
jgi:plasmid stabilization system protein ParE